MLIECLLKRDGPIIVPIGNEIYRFEPDHQGRRVAEVWLENHVEMFLASGAAALYRKVDEPPPRRDDPRYTGPDPVHAAPPPAATPTPSPSPSPAAAAEEPIEPEPPLSPEALAMTGIGGYSRSAAPSPTPSPPTPAATAPTPPPPPIKAPQVKFDRKALIERAKQLGIDKPHSTPSATLDAEIRARTS